MRGHIAAGILLTCSRLFNSKCVEIVKTYEKNARRGGGVGGAGRGVGEREGTTPALGQARRILLGQFSDLPTIRKPAGTG